MPALKRRGHVSFCPSTVSHERPAACLGTRTQLLVKSGDTAVKAGHQSTELGVLCSWPLVKVSQPRNISACDRYRDQGVKFGSEWKKGLSYLLPFEHGVTDF